MPFTKTHAPQPLASSVIKRLLLKPELCLLRMNVLYPDIKACDYYFQTVNNVKKSNWPRRFLAYVAMIYYQQESRRATFWQIYSKFWSKSCFLQGGTHQKQTKIQSFTLTCSFLLYIVIRNFSTRFQQFRQGAASSVGKCLPLSWSRGR